MPKIAKGGYLYTPQIKFGRILNNSRLCRLYGVFLRRRHSAFLQIAPITALPPVPAVFFLQIAPISCRAARYQKLSNPPLPLFARSANYTRFLRHAFFQHKSAVLQNCTHFYIFHLFAKVSAFCMCRNFKGVFGFFIFAPAFSKNSTSFACAKKSGSILTAQKEGGFFILIHQNSTLN